MAPVVIREVPCIGYLDLRTLEIGLRVPKSRVHPGTCGTRLQGRAVPGSRDVRYQAVSTQAVSTQAVSTQAVSTQGQDPYIEVLDPYIGP